MAPPHCYAVDGRATGGCSQISPDDSDLAHGVLALVDGNV